MFERFTDQARQVVVLAQEEARALEDAWIGTEHLLLGLLRGEGTLAGLVLDSLGVRVDAARADVVRIIGPHSVAAPRLIPFTPGAKRVLELALREARVLGHNRIGAEHILLALVQDADAIAVQILSDAGAEPEAIRGEVLRRLGDPQRAADVLAHSTSEKSLDQRIESLQIRERLTSERLQRMRDELAELHAEQGRRDAPGEEPDQR